MTVMIIVNAVFSVLAVAGILGHLRLAIHHDRHRVRRHAMMDRSRTSPRRTVLQRRTVDQTDRIAA